MVSAKSIIGSAGEHYAMSELLQQGFIAALAPEGVPNIDILVSAYDGSKQFAVQVKTRSVRVAKNPSWQLQAKHEEITEANLLYFFVDLGCRPEERPSLFIVPSKKVATAISKSHKQWLSGKKKNGETRKDTSMRAIRDDYSSVWAGSPLPDDLQLGWLEAHRNAWSHCEDLVRKDAASAVGEQ